MIKEYQQKIKEEEELSVKEFKKTIDESFIEECVDKNSKEGRIFKAVVLGSYRKGFINGAATVLREFLLSKQKEENEETEV